MIVDLTVPADPRLVEADNFTGFHGVAARSATFATLASGFTIAAEHLWVPVTATCTTRFSDVQELVAGTAGRALLETGDMSKGVFWAGMVQGPIHDTSAAPSRSGGSWPTPRRSCATALAACWREAGLWSKAIEHDRWRSPRRPSRFNAVAIGGREV